jgi:hypothetical protein
MGGLDYELLLHDPIEKARDEVCSRLRRVGINPFLVARDGVSPRGWIGPLLDPDGRIQVNPRDRNTVLTRFHRWRIPAQTRMGIIAAVHSYDRAEGKA